MRNNEVVEHYQYQLMSTIDQFDDLLEYISFKEAQTEIIRSVGDTVRAYMKNKDSYDSAFFSATNTIRMGSAYKIYGCGLLYDRKNTQIEIIVPLESVIVMPY